MLDPVQSIGTVDELGLDPHVGRIGTAARLRHRVPAENFP